MLLYLQNKKPSITMPPNLQEVKLKFTRRRSAKVMGSLADREEEPKEGEPVRGILVTQNFSTKIVAPEDLSTYTHLRVGSVSSKLHVPFAAQVATLRLFLNEMFSGVTEVDEGEGADGTSIITFGLHEEKIKVTTGRTRGVATVSWDASPAGDILADAVVALLMHAQSSVASIRLTSKPCGHRRTKAAADDDEEEPAAKKQRESDASTVIESRLRLVHNTLRESYENVEATYEANSASFEIQTDTGLEDGIPADGGILVCNVKIDFEDEGAAEAKITAECEDGKLAANIKECIKNVLIAAAPIQL